MEGETDGLRIGVLSTKSSCGYLFDTSPTPSNIGLQWNVFGRGWSRSFGASIDTLPGIDDHVSDGKWETDTSHTVICIHSCMDRDKTKDTVYPDSMVVGLLDDILAYLLAPALILYLLHYGLFKKYVFAVTRLILYVLQVVTGLIHGMILASPKMVAGLLKAALIAVLTVVLVLVYLATFVVPFVGGKADGWRKSLKNGMMASYITV